jgi:hypothetical protein
MCAMRAGDPFTETLARTTPPPRADTAQQHRTKHSPATTLRVHTHRLVKLHPRHEHVALVGKFIDVKHHGGHEGQLGLRTPQEQEHHTRAQHTHASTQTHARQHKYHTPTFISNPTPINTTPTVTTIQGHTIPHLELLTTNTKTYTYAYRSQTRTRTNHSNMKPHSHTHTTNATKCHQPQVHSHNPNRHRPALTSFSWTWWGTMPHSCSISTNSKMLMSFFMPAAGGYGHTNTRHSSQMQMNTRMRGSTPRGRKGGSNLTHLGCIAPRIWCAPHQSFP